MGRFLAVALMGACLASCGQGRTGQTICLVGVGTTGRISVGSDAGTSTAATFAVHDNGDIFINDVVVGWCPPGKQARLSIQDGHLVFDGIP